jgi:hypothetical protein
MRPYRFQLVKQAPPSAGDLLLLIVVMLLLALPRRSEAKVGDCL